MIMVKVYKGCINYVESITKKTWACRHAQAMVLQTADIITPHNMDKDMQYTTAVHISQSKFDPGFTI